MKISIEPGHGLTMATTVKLRPESPAEAAALKEIVERNRAVAPRDALPFVIADLYRAGYHLEWEET